MINDTEENTDMEEETLTMNGSESVLNSSFNSALSGFENLLRKQMGDDDFHDKGADKTNIGNYKHYNEYRRDKRPEADISRNNNEPPSFRGGHSQDRIDSQEYSDVRVNTENAQSREEAVAYNRRSNGNREYNVLDIKSGGQGRSSVNGSMGSNDWSSRGSWIVSDSNNSRQSSINSDQDQGRQYSDPGRRSVDRLMQPSRNIADNIEDLERTQSADKLNEYRSSHQYPSNQQQNLRSRQRNSSADALYSRHSHPASTTREDMPPRGRSTSPHRYNRRERDNAEEDNPYREMDPKFRNASPTRNNDPRDRSLSPYRLNRGPNGTPTRISDSDYNSKQDRQNETHRNLPQDGGQHSNPPQAYSQPQMRAPLLTGRSAHITASKPPVNRALFLPNGNVENGHREDLLKMQDLEDTVSTLKRLLREREREVDDLKASHRKVESELHTVRTHSPGPPSSPPPQRSQSPVNRPISYERKCDELLKEKEVLATEVHNLKKQLSELAYNTNAAPHTPHSDSRRNEPRYQTQDRDLAKSGLDNYDPNNPHALKKKKVPTATLR